MDFIYAPTSDFLLGGNASYTDAAYSAEYVQPTGARGVIDENSPFAPPSIYTIPERTVNIKGLQMLRIPKSKYAFYAVLTKDLLGGTVDYLLTYSWTSSITWDDTATALETSRISAPVASHNAEIEFIELILCAKKALATSLDNSLLQRFVDKIFFLSTQLI